MREAVVKPSGVEEGFTDSPARGWLWGGGQAVGLGPRGAFLWPAQYSFCAEGRQGCGRGQGLWLSLLSVPIPAAV